MTEDVGLFKVSNPIIINKKSWKIDLEISASSFHNLDDIKFFVLHVTNLPKVKSSENDPNANPPINTDATILLSNKGDAKSSVSEEERKKDDLKDEEVKLDD
jgi:hypothetical protein